MLKINFKKIIYFLKNTVKKKTKATKSINQTNQSFLMGPPRNYALHAIPPIPAVCFDLFPTVSLIEKLPVISKFFLSLSLMQAIPITY